MSTKTKTLLIIFGTLIIGILIGVLGSGIMRHSRMDRFERMDHSKRFFRVMEQIIQPDETQKAALEKVVEKYSSGMTDIRERHQSEIAAVLDSMRLELDVLLTEEQKNRFHTHLEKSADRMIGHRINRLADVLNLTDEQREKVEQIFQDHMETFKKNRHGLFKGDFGDKIHNFREEREKIHREIEAVLTPEQLEAFQEFSERGFFPFGHGFLGERGRRWDKKKKWRQE